MKVESKDMIRLIQTHPVSVVTTVNKDGVNDAAAFSWISPLSHNPPLLAVMVSPKRHTHKNLEDTEEFVVNIVTKHFLEETVKVGNISFQENPNKLDESDFNLKDSNSVKPCRIEEAVVWLECRVKDMIKEGDHSIVVGEIVEAEVEDEFWEDGRFLAERAETLHHVGGKKFLVGGNLIEHEK